MSDAPGLRRIAVMAVLAGLVQLGAAAAGRESRLAASRAGSAEAAVSAARLRETVLYAFGNNPGLDRDVRAAELGEALRLRHAPGEGIAALERRAAEARAASEGYALIDSEFEIAEAGLQLAILLTALGAGRRRLATGGLVLAGIAVLVAAVASIDALV